jgi:2'-hydroxyisoflavone reductase
VSVGVCRLASCKRRALPGICHGDQCRGYNDGMKILVLGGTKFLGRYLVEAALAAGDDVTIFNRGLRAPTLFPEVQTLIGDRGGDLRSLCNGSWDVVYDMSGYRPREVRATIEMLSARISRYLFVSTISVYDDGVLDAGDRTIDGAGADTTGGVSENSPVFREGTAAGDAEAYGPLKAACEREVSSLLAERGLIIRPGLIVGPHDPTFRFNYWINRLAQGGKILAPGRPGRHIQVIDVRDLAQFLLLLGAAEQPATTIFNAAGKLESLTMGTLLETVGTVLEERGGTELRRLVWVPDKVLLDQSIEEWTELPLWVAEGGALASFFKIDSSVAESSGLGYRPIRDTVEAICDVHPELLVADMQGRMGEDGRILLTMTGSLEEALLAGIS